MSFSFRASQFSELFSDSRVAKLEKIFLCISICPPACFVLFERFILKSRLAILLDLFLHQCLINDTVITFVVGIYPSSIDQAVVS